MSSVFYGVNSILSSMENDVSIDIIEKWGRAWSLSHELPLPVKFKSGFKVEVGYEQQKARYLFPAANDDFLQLSKSIADPWIFLIVLAAK